MFFQVTLLKAMEPTRDRIATNPLQQHDHNSPEDGMQDIEMIVASERVKERGKHL